MSRKAQTFYGLTAESGVLFVDPYLNDEQFEAFKAFVKERHEQQDQRRNARRDYVNKMWSER